MEFFRNFLMGCCCSDNRVDKMSDMQTGPAGHQRGVGPGVSGGNQRQTDDYNNGHQLALGGRDPDTVHQALDLPIGGVLVPREEIQKAALLKIEVIEGMAVPKNTTLSINACGLINSKRNKSDGCTIIGSQETSPSGEVFNDFVISQLDTGIGKRHMVIKYNIDNRSYYLRDLGDGSGTFVRLDIPLVLKHGYIISFGDSHMVVQFFQDNQPRAGAQSAELGASKIQLKFLDGPKTDQTFTFSESSGIIRIGRMTNCDVKFDDDSLSRQQCCILFDEGNWILKDGDGAKLSTNGTWLFVDELFKIYDQMIFKAGQTLFRAHLLANPTGK